MDSQIEDKNYALNLSHDDRDRLRELLHNMANFIALYESAEEKMTGREQLIGEELKTNEQCLDKQLQKIGETVAELKEIITEAGAARWRVAAENALSEGKQHLRVLESLNLQIEKSLYNGSEHFDRTVTNTIKDISETIDSFHLEDFKALAEECANQVADIVKQASQRIIQLLTGFHWRNLVITFCLTLIVSLVVGLYLHGEWLWEKHTEVIKERQAGQVLLKAWPRLTETDKAYILQLYNSPD